MRVRLFSIGPGCSSNIIWIEAFPATLILDSTGSIRLGSRDDPHPLCILDECGGNLVLLEHESDVAVQVNSLPLRRGGLEPGDHLRIHDHQFLVSYERISSLPIPSRYYDIMPIASG